MPLAFSPSIPLSTSSLHSNGGSTRRLSSRRHIYHDTTHYGSTSRVTTKKACLQNKHQKQQPVNHGNMRIANTNTNTNTNTAMPMTSTDIPEAQDVYRVDPDTVEDNAQNLLRSFIKVRASLDPREEAMYRFSGKVYGFVDGSVSKTEALFGIEGFSVARAVIIDNGYRLLTREVAFYTDLKTNEPISEWTNVYNNDDKEEKERVVHVWNDPVNQDLISHIVPIHLSKLNDNRDLSYTINIFPKYKSPLNEDELYESSELFNFFIDKHDLNSCKSSVDNVKLSWCRIGPWLPWMNMNVGDAKVKGRLIYHCQGCRVDHAPEYFKYWILKLNREHGHKFFHAPENVARPNETSWSYMKKLIENKQGLPRADGRIAPEENKPDRENRDAMMHLYVNQQQLKAFKGNADENIPVYTSVAGHIFNVSNARRHYGFGETYNCLTGIDASIALLSGQLEFHGVAQTERVNDDDDVDDVVMDLNKLSEEQIDTLRGWVRFFSARYELVGSLVDYDGPVIALPEQL